MNLYKKITTGLLLAVVMVGVSASNAFAQGDISDIRNQIADLKEEHKDLRAQVEAGEIDKEEAKEIWSTKIAEIRTLKDQIFDARVQKMQDRYEKVLEKNPERAEALKLFMDNMETRRAELKAEREALHAAVQSGEITREEARAQRKELHEKIRQERTGARDEFKVKRDEFKAENMEKREVMKAERDSLRQAVEAGEITREEARAAFQDLYPKR